MHITIEIDDGNEQSRVTVTGAPTGAAASSDGSEAATAAPLDAGPAPDVFGGHAETPPGVTDLAAGQVVSDGAAPASTTEPSELS